MNAPSSRLYYLDSLRGVLMVLGVVYHACLLYAPSAGWVIVDPNAHSKLYGLLSFVTHTFRMQCFFIISGFFCYLTFSRRGAFAIVKARLPRLMVPLVVSILTLTPLRSYLVYCYRGGTGGFFAQFQPNDILYFFTYGHSISHLWFLNNLVLYIVLFGLCAWGAQKLSLVQKSLQVFSAASASFLTLLVLTVFIYVCEVLDMYYGWFRFLTFAPYFYVGVYFCYRLQEFENFMAFSWFKTMLTAGVLLAGVAVRMFNVDAGVVRVASDCALVFASLHLSALCFWGFKTLFPTRNSILSAVAEASYTIYLFHMIIVAGLGYLLLSVDMNVHLKFGFITVTTTIVTLALHRLVVSRVPLLGFLYNGKT